MHFVYKQKENSKSHFFTSKIIDKLVSEIGINKNSLNVKKSILKKMPYVYRAFVLFGDKFNKFKKEQESEDNFLETFFSGLNIIINAILNDISNFGYADLNINYINSCVFSGFLKEIKINTEKFIIDLLKIKTNLDYEVITRKNCLFNRILVSIVAIYPEESDHVNYIFKEKKVYYTTNFKLSIEIKNKITEYEVEKENHESDEENE